MNSILTNRPELKRALDSVAEVAGYLWQKGWAERNGGNLTLNITEFVDDEMRAMPAISKALPIGVTLPYLKGCYFYCKGTGKRMRDLARDPMSAGSIVRILDDCASYEIIADAVIVPTSEISSHLAIQNYMLESGSGYKATLHTHPIELVAMSHSQEFLDSKHLTQVLWSMIPETLAFAPLGIGVVPYALPSSTELVEPTMEQIKRYDVVLWEKHGTVAVGPDMMEAFDQTDVLNKAANIYMTAKNFGFTAEGMTPEAVQKIRTVFNLPDKR
ncbi:MAG: rhamnulose-1-phosphate aldolase [Alistipes sp.]|nr:rhamnulose-1-phosphate aldolase [Alistipes sp.]MBQ7951824.1 rhamnulose-1-phosphate aldolase [Alistipes sp.]